MASKVVFFGRKKVYQYVIFVFPPNITTTKNTKHTINEL